MAKILCTGIATLDIINEVEKYPHEDTEIRILSQQKSRGGNAANSAVILAQSAYQCYWAGCLIKENNNDSDSQFIVNELKHYHINIDYCEWLKQGQIPTSYISLSRETGSRTISHYRDLPEYSFAAFKKINLQPFAWVHFEGRNIEQTLQMMHYCRQQYPDIPISLEIEKPRDNISSLLPVADMLLFSRQYALSQGFTSAQDICQHFARLFPHKIISCAWGESGAGALVDNHYCWQPAIPVTAIDTLGAGDVFNAAMIAGQLQKKPLNSILESACQLAAEKCQQKGFAGLQIK